MRQREILCIDDDAQSLQVRKILLETCDFRVHTATNGKDGLRYFRAHHVDAVILDYEMPDMNGGQVAKKMKDLRADVPVLVLSALPWLPNDAPKECIDAFVSKGGPTPALVNEIEQLIERWSALGPEREGKSSLVSRTGGRSMRLVGAVSGIMVEKMRGLVGKSKTESKPLPAVQ